MSDTEYEVSDRGLKYYADIPTTYRHTISIYESSAAMEPHIWLNVTGEDDCSVTGQRGSSVSAHLTLDQARTVRDTLDAAIEHHYQASEA